MCGQSPQRHAVCEILQLKVLCAKARMLADFPYEALLGSQRLSQHSIDGNFIRLYLKWKSPPYAVSSQTLSLSSSYEYNVPARFSSACLAFSNDFVVFDFVDCECSGVVALTIGSVPRRTVFELRQFD